MIEPIRLSFEVACPVDHAFATWTERTSTWWPSSHTVTGADGLDISFEPRVGGRIFERTSGGEEHDWGEITVWEPPRRLGYLWHLRVDRRLTSRSRSSPSIRAAPGSRSSIAAGSGSGPPEWSVAIATEADGRTCCRTTGSWRMRR